MKKICAILSLALLLLQGVKSFSQSVFEFRTPDTLGYGDTATGGEIFMEHNFIINKTANPISLYVVRVQDVTVASGWSSYICTAGQCFPPSIDSVNLILAAYDSSEFIPHFGITATADSQFILISVRNTNNPSDVTFQRFYGVTKIGYLGIHEYANLASVNIYPSPIISGNKLNLDITNLKTDCNDLSLVIYNMNGGVVNTANDLQEGNNTLNLELASGLYSYGLKADNVLVNYGKLSVIR